eukprot:CAMPEP_0201152028 /NCGR_PEP_ID=MMETSP0851-20130426/12828_1 /ASSEMBLY_ACC=CAM_ASM_000631 /TAXON_ID=183588 /ORGANISM="Pseudo-nitzschia fraudulenta, Strain WWA7" /LENGTH=51 /DNA_ID=CAMNT_0047428989 /DNA_START=14 /DNA_END=166 /DNA_ORIENTATION=-
MADGPQPRASKATARSPSARARFAILAPGRSPQRFKRRAKGDAARIGMAAL